jgi:hypothetical protein
VSVAAVIQADTLPIADADKYRKRGGLSRSIMRTLCADHLNPRSICAHALWPAWTEYLSVGSIGQRMERQKADERNGPGA